MNYIPIEKLERGAVYLVEARNFGIAMWTATEEFEGIRTKFGMKFLDTENHWDEGPPYGTVKPIRKLTKKEAEAWKKEVWEIEND